MTAAKLEPALCRLIDAALAWRGATCDRGPDCGDGYTYHHGECPTVTSTGALVEAIDAYSCDYAERPAITADEVRAVVREAMRTHGIQQTGGWFVQDNINRRDFDAIADRVAEKLAGRTVDSTRIAALESGLRDACDHIDDLHLPDPGLRAESVRLRALVDAADPIEQLKPATASIGPAGLTTVGLSADERAILQDFRDCAKRLRNMPVAPDEELEQHYDATIALLDRLLRAAAFDRAAVAITGLDADDRASLEWAAEFIGVHAFSDNASAGRMLGLIDRLLAPSKDGSP